jgi:hypothetical protein
MILPLVVAASPVVAENPPLVALFEVPVVILTAPPSPALPEAVPAVIVTSPPLPVDVV